MCGEQNVIKINLWRLSIIPLRKSKWCQIVFRLLILAFNRSCISCLNIVLFHTTDSLVVGIKLTLSRNERGKFGALKSDSTHHFFRNACTKSGSLRFSQFSGC